MKRSCGIFAGFTLAMLIAAGDARAQDYFQTNGGMYISGRGGLSQVRNTVEWAWAGWEPAYDDAIPPNLVWPGMNNHTEHRSLEMDYGYVVGLAIGYSFVWSGYAGAIRMEGEAIYRKNDDGEINSQWWPVTDNTDSDSLFFETVPVVGTLEVASAMYNVLVDIPTGTRFTPYLGLGAGVSKIDWDGCVWDWNRGAMGEPLPECHDQSAYALSWQAIIGVSYQLSQSLALTLEGRHFKLAGDRYLELFETEQIEDVTFGDWSMGFRLTF